MSAIAAYLGAPADLASDDVVLLRLFGRPFRRPVNEVLGEQSEDALLAFLSDPTAAADPTASTPFIRLIERLLDSENTADGGSWSADLIGQLSAEARASMAFRLIRILDDSEAAVDQAKVSQLADRFSPGPRLDGPALSAYWHLVLSRFAQDTIKDHRIAICQQMVIGPDFIGGPLIATASLRPHLFFGSVAPILFEAMRKRKIAQRNLLDPLAQAMRAAFRAFYQDGTNPAERRAQLELFAADLKILVAARRFEKVAAAVLEGAAAATNAYARHARPAKKPPANAMPFEDFSLLEASYSSGRVRVLEATANGDKKLAHLLRRYIDPVRHCAIGSQVDPVLATNLIPYSEGVYFLIWRELLGEAGISLELKHHEWGQVIKSLLDGRLSFAVLNDYVPDDLRTKTKIQLTNEPLLVYDRYPLVVRRDLLERLASQLSETDAAPVIGVLTGKSELAVEDIAHAERFLELLRKFPLGVVGNSEIADAARGVLGEVDPDWSSSDEAAAKLVDGTLGWAVLGGIQANYLARRFPHSTVTLTNIPRPTPVHLWFKEETFADRKYASFVGPLLEAWRQTCLLWRAACSNSADAQRLGAWITHLAYRLNAGVSSEAHSLRTPIGDWAELMAMSASHDRLHQPSDLKPPGSTPFGDIEAVEQTQVLTLQDLAKEVRKRSVELKLVAGTEFGTGGRRPAGG